MNRRLATLAVALLAWLACGTSHAADAASITFDAGADFSTLRTFAIRDGRIESLKPEVDNRLFRQRVNDAIRARLTRRGLKESATAPDLLVSFSFTDADYSLVERTPPARVPDLPGQRGFVVPGSGPRPVLFTEGTLVIDVFNASDVLLWRGTIRNREQSGPKLSAKLSGDASNLMSKFPPRAKK